MIQVWQAFVGVKARRVESYYQDLLVSESENDTPLLDNDSKGCNKEKADVPEKCRKQIEKVIRCMGPGIYRSIFLIRRCYFFLGPSGVVI